jgi:hypothetical protein
MALLVLLAFRCHARPKANEFRIASEASQGIDLPEAGWVGNKVAPALVRERAIKGRGPGGATLVTLNKLRDP